MVFPSQTFPDASGQFGVEAVLQKISDFSQGVNPALFKAGAQFIDRRIFQLRPGAADSGFNLFVQLEQINVSHDKP